MAASFPFSGMSAYRNYLLLLLILTFTSNVISGSIIQLYTNSHRTSDFAYCDSWKFSVETNDAGTWSTIPERCTDFVQEYMTGDRYRSDSEVVADYSLEYAKTVELTGKDAWVFDIDDTLLSNLPWYAATGFGSEAFNENSYNEWALLAEAPSLPASLRLYKELEGMEITIFLLTGRDESQRNATEKNLLLAGFTNWKKLFLRAPSDKGKLATVYKSEKRMEIVDDGYTIHGSSGDQWSDLLGFSVATRHSNSQIQCTTLHDWRGHNPGHSNSQIQCTTLHDGRGHNPANFCIQKLWLPAMIDIGQCSLLSLKL